MTAGPGGTLREVITIDLGEERSRSDIAYARFPDRQPGEYRDGWLPNES